MKSLFIGYLAALATLAVLDALWLGVVSRDFYKARLGQLLLDQPNWPVAILFYPEDVAKLRKWMGLVQQFSNERGVVWTAPTLSTKGALPYQRLGSLYDVVKEIKQLVDPNNILNPGALY